MKKKNLFLLLILLSIFMMFFVQIIHNKKQNTIRYISYEEIVVKNGDTIWEISMRYTPKDKDIRKTVYEIKKVNNINNSIIKPGQIIKVPILKKQ